MNTRLVRIVVSLAIALPAFAQINVQRTATGNISNGNVAVGTNTTLTVASGGTLSAAAGSTVTLAGNNTISGNSTVGNVTVADGRTFTFANVSGNGYSYPLQWGGGSKYSLSGGTATFNSVEDYNGGIQYNAARTAGRPAFVLGFEDYYNNGALGVDTEFYYNWDKPVGSTTDSGGVATRRIFQTNVSLGTTYGAPAAKPTGFAQWSFDVNKFTVDNGANFNGEFSIDFTSSPKRLTWQNAMTLGGALTVGGAITQSGTNTNALSGATTINASNATYAFATGNNSLLSVSNESGDAALKILRTGAAGNEYVAIGAAAGGAIFGAASNAFRYDTVSASGGTLRDLLFRYSSNSGSTYATALTLAHATGTATIGYTTASTDVSNGALVVAGGAGISGTVYAGAFRTTGIVGSYDVSNNASSRLTNSASGAFLRLNSNAVGNEKSIVFSYGATPTVQWNLGNVGYFPPTWIGFNNGIAGGGVMVDGSNNLYLGDSATAMSGSYNLALQGGVIDTRTTAALTLKVNGTTALALANSTSAATFAGSITTTSTSAGYLEGTEQASSPAAPSANGFRLYAKDNGAGKTQLIVRFASGAEQVLATEP